MYVDACGASECVHKSVGKQQVCVQMSVCQCNEEHKCRVQVIFMSHLQRIEEGEECTCLTGAYEGDGLD